MTVPVERFEHAALVVDSDDNLDDLLVPILRRHIDAASPALLVVAPHTQRVLRTRLGKQADALEWGDPADFYQRLGFAYESFRRYLYQQHARGRSVHVIAEPDVVTDLDAPVDRVAAYLSYEAVCDEVFASYRCPVTCIWDGRRHPTLVIEEVRNIHRSEVTADGLVENTDVLPASDYLTGRAQAVMPPAPRAVDVDVTLSEVDHLADSRSVLLDWATGCGFTTMATNQVAAATNEALTNAFQHGQPPVRLRTWHHADTLVTQVDDCGNNSIPPDAGYRPPGTSATGIGLWMVRQIADVMVTNSGDGVTSVRMYFPHDLTHH